MRTQNEGEVEFVTFHNTAALIFQCIARAVFLQHACAFLSTKVHTCFTLNTLRASGLKERRKLDRVMKKCYIFKRLY